MKILRESDDYKTIVVKFNKREQEIVEYRVLNDTIFIMNYNIVDTSISNEYIITQKDRFSIADCKSYLNYLFANELIDQMIRVEKINKIKNGI